MKVFRSFRLPENFNHSVLAIGNFDGVHLGHQMVIEKAKEIAKEKKKKVGVLTFEPHPKCYFKKKFSFFRLTPFRSKVGILKSLNIDFMLNINFNLNLVEVSADDFLKNFLVDLLKVEHIVTGFDFVFGHKQGGNVDVMQKFSKNYKMFDFTKVSEIKKDNLALSSSNVRSFLRLGDLEKANRILSRNWTIISRVIKGEEKARQLGFRTANLRVNAYCDLCYGVYSVDVKIFDKKKKSIFLGIANYGIKPTFHNTKPLLEVHIFNFSREIYGKRIAVSFKQFIRHEKKFDSIEKLKDQIIKDIKIVKNE